VAADPDAVLAMIVNALGLASLSTEDQVAAHPEFVHVPDEVALIFDDAYVLVPQLRAADAITDAQAEALGQIDRQFSEMSTAPDRASLWTLDAMRGNSRWEETRRLATSALKLLGAPPGLPEFSGTSWVKG
jgi:hypothetical protein